MTPESTIRRIAGTLDDIVGEHSVTIHYACESGSRAWGFASEDSDYDVRFLFVRPVEEYLVLKPHRDVIERPIIDELDVNGWDIFKACRLLRKSNPPLLEWLGSPTVYAEPTGLARQLRDQAREHFSPRACCEHYLSQVQSNCAKHLEGRDVVVRKKYLYALRPLACIRWMIAHGTFPPTAFGEVLAGIDLPVGARCEIEHLLESKRASHEMGAGPANATLNEFIRDQLEALPASVQALAPRAFPSDGLNDLIRGVLLRSPTPDRGVAPAR